LAGSIAVAGAATRAPAGAAIGAAPADEELPPLEVLQKLDAGVDGRSVDCRSALPAAAAFESVLGSDRRGCDA
jgi:hypothetical protein